MSDHYQNPWNPVSEDMVIEALAMILDQKHYPVRGLFLCASFALDFLFIFSFSCFIFCKLALRVLQFGSPSHRHSYRLLAQTATVRAVLSSLFCRWPNRCSLYHQLEFDVDLGRVSTICRTESAPPERAVYGTLRHRLDFCASGRARVDVLDTKLYNTIANMKCKSIFFFNLALASFDWALCRWTSCRAAKARAA